MQHVYETTRPTVAVFTFANAFNQESKHHETTMEMKPGRFIFRGGKRAFAAHIAQLNAEHGQGYAMPVQPSTI